MPNVYAEKQALEHELTGAMAYTTVSTALAVAMHSLTVGDLGDTE
tara:strand:- start:767 stop:901 length:135 start_codon:yes stop_codon:yes gene_type:complete